jgi:hypothetical protein
MTNPLISRLFLPLSTLSLAIGCSPKAEVTRVKSLASDIFVAITEPNSEQAASLLVSFSNETEAELCRATHGESCKADDPKISLSSQGPVNGRFIYEAKTLPRLSPFSDYVILNKAGASLMRFRLKTPVFGSSTETSLTYFSKDTMMEELSFITQDKFAGRLAGTSENEKIADFLINELKRYRIKPAFADYRQNFKMTVGPTKGSTSSNIIGLIEGSDPELKNEYVVIGAHMDHTGTTRKGYTCSPGPGNDGICNGADDNGSGTIALLNIARSLSASRSHLKRSVLIMWFSGEEEGLLGSRYYVSNPAVPLNRHVFMINMDMVGYAKSFGNAIAAIGTTTSRWGDQFVRNLGSKYNSHKLKFTNKVEGGSDHAPFMNKGIPGIFYHTGVSNNPNYHRTSDHAENIDYDGMLVASKLAYETVVAAANSSELKSRVGLSLTSEDKFVSDSDAEKGCHSLMDYQYTY